MGVPADSERFRRNKWGTDGQKRIPMSVKGKVGTRAHLWEETEDLKNVEMAKPPDWST